MAHYLAEVMDRAELSEGAAKTAAEKECFDVILQLWRHRSSLPGSPRPLQSFDPVFQALSRLLDHRVLVYFERRDEQSLDPEQEKWLEVAEDIDHGARDLIRWCIVMASCDAAVKESDWLTSGTARALDDGADMRAARLLLENVKILIGTGEQLAERQVEELTEMRGRLDRLVALSEMFRDQIDAVLKQSSNGT